MMCWIAGSYLFAAVTLSSISIYEGGLTPSVAFTALAIFQRLETTFSLVPGLATDFLDAWVSFDRLERFLSSPEQVDNTVHSNFVSFEDASIDWPSDEQFHRQAKLHSLILKFPASSLSVIAGPTGVGKSLLLSAIAGEADLLSGTVRRPKSSLGSRVPSNEFSGIDWIVPNTMALVAQTPWIENASLRDNILFGLPFAESRYTRVLRACALLDDLGSMEDGDMTEIGAHGIGFSGGQRSRLSLARAFHSLAEILVIDDIFSAVDTHVGRHLLDHALTGDLAQRRTCILATHNLQLCLPKATFVVMLNDGTAEYAGLSKEIPQRFYSTSTESIEEDNADSTSASADQPSLLTEATAQERRTFPGSSGSGQKKPIVASDLNAESSESADKPYRRPKKLVQEEGREIGRVKLNVWRTYFSAASACPWVYWLVVISLLIGYVSLLTITLQQPPLTSHHQVRGCSHRPQSLGQVLV